MTNRPVVQIDSYVTIRFTGSPDRDDFKAEVVCGDGVDEDDAYEVIRRVAEDNPPLFDLKRDWSEWIDMRTFNALLRNGLDSLRKISEVTPADIWEIRNIGWRSTSRVEAMMRHNGYPDWGTKKGNG